MNLKLAQLRLDGGTQPRETINQAVVNDYAEAMRRGDPFPAMTVYFDDENYWLADGFHRYYAALLAGLHEFPADIVNDSLRAAILYSVGANAKHGLWRRNADKRRSVMALLSDPEWGKWSDSEIARQCKVSNHLVARIRSEVTANSRSENNQRTYTTKHGTQATLHTANIGHKPKQEPAVDAGETALCPNCATPLEQGPEVSVCPDCDILYLADFETDTCPDCGAALEEDQVAYYCPQCAEYYDADLEYLDVETLPKQDETAPEPLTAEEQTQLEQTEATIARNMALVTSGQSASQEVTGKLYTEAEYKAYGDLRYDEGWTDGFKQKAR